MKIYNEDKTELIDNPDLDKGYLINDKIIVGHKLAKEEVQEKFHYEVIKEYANGGKDIKKIIDVPYSPAIPEHDIYEDIKIYIEYTAEEKAQRRITELKNLLQSTDYQAIKYAEGQTSAEDYEPMKKQRQEWRDEINRLGG